jgi:hypothetical protein
VTEVADVLSRAPLRLAVVQRDARDALAGIPLDDDGDAAGLSAGIRAATGRIR